MIKNSFWQKFKLKTERNYKPGKEKLIYKVRPLSLKEIKRLKFGKLQIFIDDIISNKKINNLLFATNAKKELAFFYRQQNAVLKNMNFVKSYDPKGKSKQLSEIEEIFLRKKNALVSETIKKEIEDYKINKKIEDKNYKMKLFRLSKNKENIDETATKLFFKSVNDIRYSDYKRSLDKCFEKCKSDPNFNLPDVSLDINDVFSRLYHNMILTPIKSKSKQKKINNIKKNILSLKRKIPSLTSLKNINTMKKIKSIKPKEILTDDYELNRRTNKKFNLKDYFKEYKGKEFLISQSLSSRNLCWKKNSGGPGIKLELPGKINLNKFKKNKTLEKEDNYIIDVNDYRDHEKNSNLHLAVKDNNEKFVKYFIDKNYNPNEQNILGDTPLHEAIRLKNKNIIQLLINDGGNLNIKNNNGFTPYDLADRKMQSTFNFQDEKKIIFS